MPGDWSNRLRLLSDMPKNRETLSRLTASAPIPNPFRSPPAIAPPHPAANPSGASPPPGPDPFAPAPYTGPVFAAPPARPVPVRVAVFSLLSAAVLALVLALFGVYAIAELRGSVDNLINIDPSGTATMVASDYVEGTQLAVTFAAAALGAVVAGAYLLVARAIWKGRSWPRQVSPFFAVLSLPALLLGPVAIAAVAAGIVATLAAWMPSSRAFATQTRAYAAATRRARRGWSRGQQQYLPSPRRSS